MYSNHWLIAHITTQVGYVYFGEVSALPIIKTEDYPDEITVRPLAKLALTLPDLKRLSAAISEHCAKMEEAAELNSDKDDSK